MNIYITPNPNKPAAAQLMCQVGEILAAEGAQLIVDTKNRQHIREKWHAKAMPAMDAFAACDMILTIGGDGTMLHAALDAMMHNKPLVGVNVGRLGFLTTVESDELDKLRRLPNGAYTVENRAMLCATAGDNQLCYALNDIVLFKERPERSASLNIYCDDILVSRFRGDGIIFATPTGSTAYSMSAGGPILDARLGGVVVTQICAHIVQTPPMVFASDRLLRAVPTGTAQERVVLSCDGGAGRCLGPEEAVCITQSDKTVPMVQFGDAEQLESIDKKLKGR